MRFLTNLILLVLISISGLRAQHYVGLKWSSSINKVDAVPYFPIKSMITNDNYGIVYRYDHKLASWAIKPHASFQAEFLKIHKGFIQDTSFRLGLDKEIKNEISSIELPLMARAYLQFGIFRPYVVAGGTIGYILSRTVQEQGSDAQDFKFGKFDRRFEYGIGGGGGLGIVLGNFELQGEARFHYDFSFLRDPIIQDHPVVSERVQSMNTTRLMISAVLLYRLNNK